MVKNKKCIECGKIIPKSRDKFITCSKICSNKRATTPSKNRTRRS